MTSYYFINVCYLYIVNKISKIARIVLYVVNFIYEISIYNYSA